MLRFCRHCGQELLNPHARFCARCGASLSSAAGPAALQLHIHVPGQADRCLPLNRAAFSIGRNPDNDIVLPAEYVSAHQGHLMLQGAHWVYTDLNSTNGTYVNGKRVTTAWVQAGDILRIGDPFGNSVSLKLLSPSGKAAAGGTVHIGTTTLGQNSTLIIGRNPQADIALPAPMVSWQHARLERTPQGYRLYDLNSTNGTYINGQRVQRPTLLKPGDKVQIGPFKLVFHTSQIQQYAAQGGMRLDGLHLTREVQTDKGVKRILNDVSVCVYPREFVGLVGSSGAGKTTLMKALNGFTRVQGEVLVNGDDLYRQFNLYRTLIGYVPQDDIIHRDLTVAAALRYAAQLRLPADTSMSDIEIRIDTVLTQVEMLAQKEQPISLLSGGQRKRVSIAVELLADPKLFFLDEPTSGLDPGLDKKMMQTLRNLADDGRTILLVTHATTNIAQCDLICFMAQGRIVYFGPPHEAANFFSVSSGDFADIYSAIDNPDPKVARQQARDWEARYQQSQYYQQYVVNRSAALQRGHVSNSAKPTAQSSNVNPLRQFAILTKRYSELVRRDRLLMTVLLAVMPIIGVLLLIISKPNWLTGDTPAAIEQMLQEDLAAGETFANYVIAGRSQTVLFAMGLAAVLLGLFAASYEIVKEQPIYERERMVALKIIPYLGSKLVVLGAFALLQCFLLLLVVGLRIKLPLEGVFLPAVIELYITLVLGALVAIAMGLFVSALVPNTNTVIYIVLLVLFFQIIFSGVLFDLPGFAKNFSYLTPTRWVVESMGISANIEKLNALSQNMFQPDPATREVSISAPEIDPDWEPFSVITETLSVPCNCSPGHAYTVPIDVLQCSPNTVITRTRTLTETVEFAPEPVLVESPAKFQLNYERSFTHLMWNWFVLCCFGALFFSGTLWLIKAKDVG